VKDAAAAYRSMLKWRAENDVERIRAEVAGKPLQATSFPHWEKVLGITREHGGDAPILDAGLSFAGDLVSIELVGTANPTALLEGTTEKQLLENFIGYFELRQIVMDDLSYAHGRLVKTFQLRDLGRFGLHLLKHRRASSTFQTIVKGALDNYPEALRTALCVNSPASFQLAWKGLSWFLNKRTQSKIMFVGADFHEQLMGLVPSIAIAKLHLMNRVPSSSNDVDAVLHAESYGVAVTVSPRYPFRTYVYVTRTGERSCVSLALEGNAQGLQVTTTLLRNESTRVVRDLIAPSRPACELPRFEFPENGPADGFVEVCFESNAWMFSSSLELTVRVSASP
jgi:hypothetical protein